MNTKNLLYKQYPNLNDTKKKYMVEYYRDRNEATCIFDEENKKVFNVITCAEDFLNLDHDKTRTLFDKNEFIAFAQKHGEMNMLQLFKHFNYPIPETEEEKKDPKFCLHILYKKDSEGKLVPRENIYYCEKNVKGYKNPLKSTYSLLDDGTKIDNKFIKPLNKQEDFGVKKKLKISKDINNLRKTINSRDESQDYEKNKKLLKYNLCMEYYGKQLEFQDIKNITLDKITSLGKIYYVFKRAKEEKDELMNPFNNSAINKNKNSLDDDDDHDENDGLRNCFGFRIIVKNRKKEEPKKTITDKLLENSKIADKNFGFPSVKPGESQLLIKDLCDIKIESNNENNNNIAKVTDSQILSNQFNNINLTSQKNNEKYNNNNSNPFMNNNCYLRRRNNESQYGECGNSLLFDDFRLVLILKGKRIDYTDWDGVKNRNKYYFRFYVEDKLLNTVEVIFNQNVAKEDLSKFKNVMSKVKINEEIIVVFAYNPTLYFNIRKMKYSPPPSYAESVFYIDSSKENPNVTKIFEELNK